MTEHHLEQNDVVILGGTIVDGTGDAPHLADIAIRDGHIAEIGDVNRKALTTLDVRGCWVTPDFLLMLRV